MIACIRTPKNRLRDLVTGGYISRAAAKSAAGISLPDLTRAHNRAVSGFFVCEARPHLRIMVGRAGASTDAPVSLVAGKANPVRLTTPRLASLVGELSKPTREGALSWQPFTISSRTPASRPYPLHSHHQSRTSSIEQPQSRVGFPSMHALPRAICCRRFACRTSSAICAKIWPPLARKPAHWGLSQTLRITTNTATPGASHTLAPGALSYPLTRRASHA
ncbi:ash family protein [Edwardsiella tarda]|nr:ash family protein [Edwardsiella tarda]